jgi:hypothetical protein
MIPRLLRRCAALFCLLSLLLVSLPDELVLCIGDDGHVSIEFAPAPQAFLPDGAHAEYTSIREACGCENECGPCRDARLRSGDLTARRAESQHRSAVSPGLATAVHVGARMPAVSRDRARTPLPTSLPPPLRGTNVLLI